MTVKKTVDYLLVGGSAWETSTTAKKMSITCWSADRHLSEAAALHKVRIVRGQYDS
jgi:hypothetical protein